MMAPPSSLPLQPATSRRALSARGANLSDCALISSRLPYCRLSDEFVDWYQWHGYAYSTTNAILQRAQYNGISPIVLLDAHMRLEVLLSACLCAFPTARHYILAQHHKSSSSNPHFYLSLKIYALLREGNPRNVPVSERSSVSERSNTRHVDTPSFFYELPFHYFNSSPLVEAWFAAPTARERRNLISWPSHADIAKKFPCPLWKLFAFEEIPQELFRLTGSSKARTHRAPLHPQIELIFDLLSSAIEYGNIRVSWRPRFQLLLDKASNDTLRKELRRQLIFSLIFGDVRDVPGYSPPDALLRHSYTFTSTVLDVTCVPICYQHRRVSSLPGFSLPVRGPTPHAPRRSFFLGVQSQIASYNHSYFLADSPPELESDARSTAMAHSATAAATTSDAATAAAVKSMAEHAEDWARELIESTRDPRGPARHEFPRLACPATGSSMDADALTRSVLLFSDTDEDEGDCHQPPEEL